MKDSKPMLACDWKEGSVRFPVIAQPKIDGVRGLNLEGTFTGRSFKRHKNVYTTNLYSGLACYGFDGEVAANVETHPRLCSLTTSALNTIDGEPYTLWWLFDYVTEHTETLGYQQRYEHLIRRVEEMRSIWPKLAEHLRVMPAYLIHKMEELESLEAQWLDMGFEGVILRDPNGKYKNGRATQREATYLRIKRFVEREAVVISIVEGESNSNEAKINELGQTERSSHQAGMVPNGMVGALQCRDWETGQDITVAAGCMTHHERQFYFKNPNMILGKIIKYKTFPKGVKDKPRFPTFQSIRAESDM